MFRIFLLAILGASTVFYALHLDVNEHKALMWAIFIPLVIIYSVINLGKLKCPYCYKRVKLGANTCHHCGADVSSFRTFRRREPIALEHVHVEPHHEPSATSQAIIPIPVVVVIFALVITGMAFLILKLQ
jgi:hypothetical protein